MVLRPILDSEPAIEPGVVPAWTAVERRQKMRASAWLLITQADHAGVSGQIAAHCDGAGFPVPPPEAVRAIALHDAGWSRLEGDPAAPPRLHEDGRPVCFFEVAPRDFLAAWAASIERAIRDSPLGGYIVSRHFSTLGQFRIDRGQDPAEVESDLRRFVAAERARQNSLSREAPHREEWDACLVLLQFCDILSLYLCSGTRQTVEFPQCFQAGKVRAQREGDNVSLSPTPLRAPLQLRVPARSWPPGVSAPTIQISLR